MNIALAQFNPTIADFEANRNRIRRLAEEAKARGADLLITPEMSLCGYPPMDLLDQPSFIRENLKHLRVLQDELPRGIGVLVGCVDRPPEPSGKSARNTMVLIDGSVVVHRQAKTLLPTYDVFDEARYFVPAASWLPVPFRNHRIGIAICEDMWWEDETGAAMRYSVDPVRRLLDAGADIIVVPSASPFYAGKPRIRLSLMEKIGRSSGVPVVYVNTVGANDSLVFDGHSLVTDRAGRLVLQCAKFREELAVIDPFADGLDAVRLDTGADAFEDIAEALRLGIRDYLRKTGFSKVHLGLSGGIDSALVAVLAAQAVGPENVTAFMLPSRYSSPGSVSDSEELGARLGIGLKTIPIDPIVRAFEAALEPHFENRPPDVAEENVQARVRGSLLMAYSNKFGSLLLTTGNKSELAVGYCTLYGDMAGSLAVIGDLFKTEVYALSRHLNRGGEIIPKAILTKAPSAELRPDQTDQDSLPAYELLDRILASYILEHKTADELTADGFPPETVSRVLRLVAASEYKRRQAPPVLKVSPRAFGTGRRIPIARAFSEC